MPRVGFPEPETFTASLGMLRELLDAIPAQLGIPYERIVLGGFSQGTVMSYALALGQGAPVPRGARRAERLHPDRRRDGNPTSRAARAAVWIGHGRATR